MKEVIKKAEILVEALPYIKRFHGKVAIIKLGGSTLGSEALKRRIALDLVLLKYVGILPVLVHGGGPAITQALKDQGKTTEFIHGLRVTDDATLKVVEQVLVGQVNGELVSLVNEAGGAARSINGREKGFILAGKYAYPPGKTGGKQVDLGHVGEVKAFGRRLLSIIRKGKSIPVIAPLGRSQDGTVYNINADEVAGQLAAALPAEKLVLLTDVPGILSEQGNEESLLSTLKIESVEDLIADGMIGEGMIPKVQACITALHGGVGKSHIIDGRMNHALLLELFTDRGVGTEIIHS